jgi:adenine-specific DNA-methyltransferase
MTPDELSTPENLPIGARIFRLDNLTSQRPPGDFAVSFNGKVWRPGRGYWKTGEAGMAALIAAERVSESGSSLAYKRFLEDFPVRATSNVWTDMGTGSFTEDKLYVVQTSVKVAQRCLLMTTDPGDLVFDPTCGSGTTAYVAEQWGRRWITCDASRVPLALARQRLLTATFDWYDLADPKRGPAGGFVYKRRQNSKGEEIGGIVPHVTLKSIANNEPPKEEVLVDRPEINSSITRVTGRFCVEATIPAALDPDQFDARLQGEPGRVEAETDRMLEVLRASPLLRLPGNRTVKLRNIRRPAKTLSLSAEAVVDSPGSAGGLDEAIAQADADNGGLALTGKAVALVFGPETAAVAEKTVFDAAREAVLKGYSHLYVIGFAIQPAARAFIEQCEALAGIPATYVQASPDLMMGDLLKHMRSSQIFAVCGLPEVKLRRVPRPAEAPAEDRRAWFVVELLGLDVFNPATNEVESRKGSDVPAWFLDHDYNELSFHANQAFFPRTAAWDNLKRSLRGEFADEVWAHLAGAVSMPFPAGERGQIAVKAIDDRGNELMVVKKLTEAEEG